MLHHLAGSCAAPVAGPVAIEHSIALDGGLKGRPLALTTINALVFVKVQTPDALILTLCRWLNWSST